MKPIFLNNFTLMSLLRQALNKELFSNMTEVTRITELIVENVDIISVNILDREITIKIKKTTMKKNNDFNHNALYYYKYINNAYRSYLHSKEYEVQKIVNNILLEHENKIDLGRCVLRSEDTWYHDVIDDILEDEQLCMLYQATCISDNILVITL